MIFDEIANLILILVESKATRDAKIKVISEQLEVTYYAGKKDQP